MAGRDKINLTRWNLTAMRSPLLRYKKNKLSKTWVGERWLNNITWGREKKKRNLRVFVGWKLNMSQWQVVAS